MKTLFLILLSILFSNSALAGIGGSSGGTSSAKFVTVEVCDGDGTSCRKLTYVARPQNNYEPEEVLCAVGETYGPCAKNFGTPTWLKKFNDRLTKPGRPTNREENSYSSP